MRYDFQRKNALKRIYILRFKSDLSAFLFIREFLEKAEPRIFNLSFQPELSLSIN